VTEILKKPWQEDITETTCFNCWIKSALYEGYLEEVEQESALERAVVAELRELASEVAADQDIAISADEIDEQVTHITRAVEKAGRDGMTNLVNNCAGVEEVGRMPSGATKMMLCSEQTTL
jgi:hypothetical protein